MSALVFVIVLLSWKDMTGTFPFEGAAKVSIDGSVHKQTTRGSADVTSEKP